MKTLLFTAVICPFLQASIFRFVGAPTAIVTVNKLQIPVYNSAVVSVPEGGLPDVQVYTTGRGTYTKSLGFISVDVYYAQSFIDCYGGFNDKEAPLNDIKGLRAMVMHFTYLRNISSDQLRNGFEEMLAVNGVDVTDPFVAKSLNDLDFDVAKGDVSTLVGTANDRRLESLFLESANGVRSNKAPNLAYNFWQVWFGVPVDAGMKSLKAKLSGSRY